MDRIILRYQGNPENFSTAVSAVEKLSGVNILERTPRMLLVEASSTAAGKLASMPEWTVSPESYTPLPDTRKHIGRHDG